MIHQAFTLPESATNQGYFCHINERSNIHSIKVCPHIFECPVGLE